jgi:hypothetical protein
MSFTNINSEFNIHWTTLWNGSQGVLVINGKTYEVKLIQSGKKGVETQEQTIAQIEALVRIAFQNQPKNQGQPVEWDSFKYDFRGVLSYYQKSSPSKIIKEFEIKNLEESQDKTASLKLAEWLKGKLEESREAILSLEETYNNNNNN